MSVYSDFTFYSDNGEPAGRSFVRTDRDGERATKFFWNPEGEVFDLETAEYFPAQGDAAAMSLNYHTRNGDQEVSFYNPAVMFDEQPLTESDDNATFGNGNDSADGGGGNDVINAGGGNNFILGGDGDDRITGIAQRDIFFGGAGNDFLAGGSQNDYLMGDGGNDEVRGQNGNDILSGGEGDDRMDGGPGDDIIFDLYGNNTVYGKDGEDFIILGEGNDYVSAGDGDDIVEDSGTTDEGINKVHGGNGNDHISATSGSNRFFGDAGDDVISAADGGDHLKGGDGNDIMYGGGGADELYGEAGNDILYADGNFARDLGEDKLRGGDGNDTLVGGNAKDTLYGDADDDLLVATADGKALMWGLEGNDTFAFMGFHSPMHYIRDFGAGDAINVSDMLTGYDPLTDDINDFVQLNYRDATRTDIRINADGEGTGFTSLAGIFADLTGVTVSDMLASGQLIADQKLFGSDFG